MIVNVNRTPYKFLTMCVILGPFLHSYQSGIPGVTLGEILLIIACFLVLLRNNFLIPIKNVTPLWIFILVGLATSMVSMLMQQSDFSQVPFFDVVSRMIRYSAYVIFVTLSAKYFNLGYALKYFRFFCIALSGYIILQFVFYSALGIVLPTKILPFEWSRLYDVEALAGAFGRGYFRAYGVFAEPGYAVKFLLPGFAFSLFGWTRTHKVDYWTFALIAIAISLTASVQGIMVGVITVILWLIWGRPGIKNPIQRLGKKQMQVIVSVAVLMAVFFALNSLGLFDKAFSRIHGIMGTYLAGGGSSTGMRLFRGWSIFAAMPFCFKIVGAGLGNVANFISDHNIVTVFDSSRDTISALEYTSGISGIAITMGLIGFMFFCNWLVRLFTKVRNVQRVILLQLIILLFGGGGLFSLTMVFYMGFIYTGYER